MKRFLAFLSAIVLCAAPCFAQSKEQARKEALAKEIEMIDRQIKQLGGKAANAESALVLTRKKIDAQKAMLMEDAEALRGINAEIDSVQNAVSESERKMVVLQDYSQKMLLCAYKNRTAKTKYLYILSSNGLSQSLRRSSYLRRLSQSLMDAADEVKSEQAKLEASRATLQKEKLALEKAEKKHSETLASLKASEKRESDLVKKLNADRKAGQAKLASRKKEMAALDKKLKAMVQSSENRKVAYGKDFASSKGKLDWPVDEGVLTEKFGQHNHPVYKNIKLPFNNGIGISVAKGAEARVVYDGEVSQVVVMPGYGKCVLVQHGKDYFTFYCKLSQVSVKSGDKIKRGTVVGKVDTIGGETVLHFQLWKGRVPQNPVNWLK